MPKNLQTTTHDTIFAAPGAVKNDLIPSRTVVLKIFAKLANKKRAHYPSFYGTAWYENEFRNSKNSENRDDSSLIWARTFWRILVVKMPERRIESALLSDIFICSIRCPKSVFK